MPRSPSGTGGFELGLEHKNEQALIYAWHIWDKLFGTNFVQLLNRHGYTVSVEPPQSWEHILFSQWLQNVGLRRPQSILSSVALRGTSTSAAKVYSKLSVLSEEESFADSPRPEPNEVQHLVEAVEQKVKRFLSRSATGAAHQEQLWHMNALMQWGMSRVAFHPELPEVSLYNAASSAAALATCLAATQDAERPLLLAAFDLSGIQRYVFAVQDSEVSGVGKRLRARSFFLEAFMNAVLVEVLRRLCLPPTTAISRAGGQAFLLLPNSPSTLAVLRDLQAELDAHCLTRLEGTLSVHVAWTAFALDELRRGYTEVHRKVGERLAYRKRRSLEHALLSLDKPEWCESAFIFGDNGTLSRCPSCRRVGAFTDMCPDCARDTMIGAGLARSDKTFLVRTTGENGDDSMLFGEWQLSLSEPSPKSEAVALCFGAEPPDDLAHPIWWSEKARHVPIDPSTGGILDFNRIAETSTGREMLAYIKADIDHLGMLFAFGIPPTDRVARVCQVCALSTAIEGLFSAFVQRLLAERYPNAYTVFSGGDDLLLVAPWSDGLEIALLLRAELVRRSGDNPDLGMSAAVHVVKPRLPLALAVEGAEVALETAKGHVRAEGSDRNQVTLFGRPMEWVQAVRLLLDAQMLYKLMTTDRIKTNALYQLRELALMYRAYKEAGSIEGLRFVPLLRYRLARWKAEYAWTDTEEHVAWFEALADLQNQALAVLPETLRCVHLLRQVSDEGRETDYEVSVKPE